MSAATPGNIQIAQPQRNPQLVAAKAELGKAHNYGTQPVTRLAAPCCLSTVRYAGVKTAGQYTLNTGSTAVQARQTIAMMQQQAMSATTVNRRLQ